MLDKGIQLVIVGAGNLGREVYAWLSDVISESNYDDNDEKKCEIKGFLDDNSNALDGFNYTVPIIGSTRDYMPLPDDRFVLAIMEPETKKKIVMSLQEKGAKFFTLLHPSVELGKNVEIKKGCVICPNVILTSDITLDEFVFVNVGSVIGHDVRIGSFSSINPHVTICGKVVAGDLCTFGVSATIVPGRKIGRCAFIGAGSVVISHLKPNQKVFGNPAIEI